jgi:hypothetical protein
MVKELQEQKPTNSNIISDWVDATLVSVFENGMNNDLDVKTVFDGLYETICDLHKKRGTLSVKDIESIIDDLRRIDSVLQFIL